MLRTEEELYCVSGTQSTHVWLEVMEGRDAGLRVSVPRRHHSYDAETAALINDLESGEYVRAVLVSPEDPPEWHVKHIERDPPGRD